MRCGRSSSAETIGGRAGGPASAAPAAIAAVPLADTLKRADAQGRVAATLDRAGLWRAQTPQGFRFADILAAHEAAASAGVDLTDDAAVAEWAGLAVTLVAGQRRQHQAHDAPRIWPWPDSRARSLPDVRTGTGFDVHRFVAGDHVWLCGVRIPHTHGLQGHSDADVGLHALTDALLGAIGDGDIGQHFSDTDPRWKGAASHIFLADAARRVRARGGVISNVDVTLLCEAPKIAPHRDAMRAAHRRHPGHRCRPRRGQGHDHRRPGLHRPPRRHRRPCRRNRDPAAPAAPRHLRNRRICWPPACLCGHCAPSPNRGIQAKELKVIGP